MAVQVRRSDLADVGRLRSLGALGDLVLHLLTFREAAKSLHLDGGVVDEHVLAATVGSDEAVTLRVVEPLHGTCRHSRSAFRNRLPCRGASVPCSACNRPEEGVPRGATLRAEGRGPGGFKGSPTQSPAERSRF